MSILPYPCRVRHFLLAAFALVLATAAPARDPYPDVPNQFYRVGLLEWRQLQADDDGRRRFNLFADFMEARAYLEARYRGEDKAIYAFDKGDLAKTPEGREFLGTLQKERERNPETGEWAVLLPSRDAYVDTIRNNAKSYYKPESAEAGPESGGRPIQAKRDGLPQPTEPEPAAQEPPDIAPAPDAATVAQDFFVFRPISARPSPKDFSDLGASNKLNTTLRNYQTKPSMTTAIGVLKFFPEFYKMTVDQRRKLFDADPDLFLSVDVAKYELVMQTRIAVGAKSSRRVGSTGQRELAIIKWRKGEGPKPGLAPAKQFTSDDDVTNLTDSPDLLADEKVNGVKAEEAFRRLTRQKYNNELDPKDIQTEFLSPTKAWAVFKSRHPGAIPPPPNYLYAWVASNPEKYNEPFGVYMLDVWGYDKGVVTQNVGDPLNTTKRVSEVYGAPTRPPASGKFAYIADNYRQIYDVHHGRFESECKYLVRMIDAWEAVAGKAALPPGWEATRAMADAVYKKGVGVPGARQFQGRIKGIIKNVVVTAHNYHVDRVIAELLPVYQQLQSKPDGKLTRSDFEQHAKLTEELNGMLIAYTNVPEDVHKELMKQFRQRIQQAAGSQEAIEAVKSRAFMHIMEIVQDETNFQKGNIQAFERIRASVTDQLGDAVDGADLAQFLEDVAKGGAETTRLRLQGLWVVREKVHLTPQAAMRQIEFIHALAEAFQWPNEQYARKVKEYFSAAQKKGELPLAIAIPLKLSENFDSTDARPATLTYTDDSGNTVTETVVPSRVRSGLKLFAVAIRGGVQGVEWWGNVTNGRDLYLNLHKLYYEGGSMSDLEFGQTQAALLANIISFNNLVNKWQVPTSAVLTSNVVGSLSANAGAVGYDDSANDELLYAAFKDAAIMYQPQLALAIALYELRQWGYKEWGLSGAKNDIVDAMVENGVWEPADIEQLKQLEVGKLPALKGIRWFEGGAALPVTTLAKVYAPLSLIESKREVHTRDKLLDIAHDGGYLDSDPVLQASVGALNEMSGTYFWRRAHLGVLPTGARRWNKSEMQKLGIDIARSEDDRAKVEAGQITISKREDLELGQNQLRLMGLLMADYWVKRQTILEDGLLPELEKQAARRYLNKLKAAEAEASKYDFMAQLDEIYASLKKIDQKLWPRVAPSATPFADAQSYDPDQHTPILDAFKQDQETRTWVDMLQGIQNFMRDRNATELRLQGDPSGDVVYDRLTAPKEGIRIVNKLRSRYYKLHDRYEQVHGVLDAGVNLAAEGKVKVDPLYIGFQPGSDAPWGMGEVLTPIRGDLAIATKWKDGYYAARNRVFDDVAEKSKFAAPGSVWETVARYFQTLDTSGSPSHPLWPQLIKLRYQIHSLELMSNFAGTMEARELNDAVATMTIKEGQNVNPESKDLYNVAVRSAFLTKTIAQMEAEYQRLLASLTELFQVIVNAEPAKPYIGQDVLATATPKLAANQPPVALNAKTGFPAYVGKFRWTVKALDGTAVSPSAETDDPKALVKMLRTGPHRLRLEVLDRGGNVVAKSVFDGPQAQPLLVWGKIAIKSGDYENQSFALRAGGWQGEASTSGPFSIELNEFDEALWKNPNTRVQAQVVADGKTYYSNRSELEPVDPRTGLLELKEDLEFALPHKVTINVATADRAGLPVPGAEATILVDGADKGKGNSVTAKLVTGAAVSAVVDYAPLNLTFATPAVIFDPAQGRTLTVKAELPMLDTGHLTVSGRFVPEAAISPQPQLDRGSVTANLGIAAVTQGAFALTNSQPIDLSSGRAKFEAQALVTDAAGKQYLPKVMPIAGTVTDAKLDLGAIEVARMRMTVKPIQVQLLDWTGKPIAAGAGQTMVTVNGVAVANQGGIFVGEHTFGDESESTIIEGAFTLPNGQQSVWQQQVTPNDFGGWQQDPPPPPLLQLKLPFYLPGSLRVSGRTRLDGVPQGRSAPGSVNVRDDQHQVNNSVAGDTGFDFVFPVPVQVTENIAISASAEDGDIKYKGAVATKAPSEGGSLNLGEIVLKPEGVVSTSLKCLISPPVLGAPMPPRPLGDVTVPDLAGFLLDGKADIGAMKAKVESEGLSAGSPFAFATTPPERKLEFQFASQSHGPGTQVPCGTPITVSIYQELEEEQRPVGSQTGLVDLTAVTLQSCPGDGKEPVYYEGVTVKIGPHSVKSGPGGIAKLLVPAGTHTVSAVSESDASAKLGFLKQGYPGTLIEPQGGVATVTLSGKTEGLQIGMHVCAAGTGAAVWRLTESVVNPGGAPVGEYNRDGGRFTGHMALAPNKMTWKGSNNARDEHWEFTFQYDPPPAELRGGETYKLKVLNTASYTKNRTNLFLGGGYEFGREWQGDSADYAFTISKSDPDPPGSGCQGQAGWCGEQWVAAGTSEWQLTMPTDAPDRFVIYQAGSPLVPRAGAFTYEKVK
jgi:hypothetical protein